MVVLSLSSGAKGVAGWRVLSAEESNPDGYPRGPIPPNPAIPSDGFPITVPGDVHSALISAGRIPDPYYGSNELEVQWVGQSEWIVTTEFDVSSRSAYNNASKKVETR